MPRLLVTTREGVECSLQTGDARSVMEIIRDSGVGDILALCGGNCSCATCHVYVDASFAGRLPAMDECEEDLLDASEHRDARSRLACQIPFDETLDGLKVTIAPPD